LLVATTALVARPFVSRAAVDDQPPTDKSQFTLFDPTPRALMREMSTDRPDTTESPYSVDAGHVQFELSFVDYAHNDDDGVRTNALSVMPTNIKVGLLNNVDIQFVFTPYVHAETDDDAAAGDQDSDGFSDDTQIRLKLNLWGNDGPHSRFGETGLALMPFVKFPTGTDDVSNHHVEGGLIIPFAASLPGEWSLGAMAEIDAVYNADTGDYGVEFVHTVTVSHDIPGVENLAFYLEYVGLAPYDTGSTYLAIASGGLTYALSGDWILDCGATAGISDAAEDVTVFVGTSFRF
jgi:hypothetical protein